MQDIYDAWHNAYFNSWDNGKYKGNLKYVVMQTSGGLYLRNYQKYFEEFKGSYSLTPIRDIKTYIASEKTRLARRFFGARRFQKPTVPNFLVKYFNEYDLNTLIRTWHVSITRLRILQEKLDQNPDFIIYKYEDLVKNTEDLMQNFSKKINLKFDKILLKPTLAGKDWLGNSHEGKQKGINLSKLLSTSS